MNNFKSLFSVLCIIIIGVIGISAFNMISDASDYVRVTAIDYKAEVVDEPESKGKVKITEQLTFDIRASSKSDLYWELWRDLPEETVDGVKVTYNVLSVKRLTVDGVAAPLEFKEAATLYWEDNDYISTKDGYGPNRWYHSKGPYDGEYNFECVLLYVDGLYRETDVFEIEYEMYNASMRYGDCSELYLSLYSGKTIKYLESVKGQILIPEDKMPRVGNYDAATFGTNSNTFGFTEVKAHKGYNTFYFDLDKSQLKFSPYNRYIEFTLVSHGEDKHKFTQYASVNTKYYNDIYSKIVSERDAYMALPAKYKTNKLMTLVILIGISALILFLVLSSYKKIKDKYKFNKPSVDYDLYRDIPSPLDATFAGALVFCKHKLSDDVPGGFAAAMLSLIKKGYIEVEKISGKNDWVSTNVSIIIKQQPVIEASGTQPQERPKSVLASMSKSIIKEDIFNFDKPEPAAEPIAKPAENPKPALTQMEEQYYNLICKHSVSGQIALSSLQSKVSMDYQNTASFVKNTSNIIKNTGASNGYFAKGDYKRLKVDALKGAAPFAIIGVIITILANLISFQTRLDLAFGAFFILGASLIGAAIMKIIFSRKYVLLTQLGEDEYSKWRGLYNFLNSDTLMNERTVPDIAIWEEYLIYATAFGISEKVIKALNVRFPEFSASNSLIVRHPFLCSMTFTRVYSRSFRTSTRTASMTSRVGGFGGGGSYGGGGRGGGGGGGGH